MKLIVATGNRHKYKEVRAILAGLTLEISYLGELKENFTMVEDGETFTSNAVKKALPVSYVYSDDYVVGEDSGLEVPYLNNAPGIYSRRYAGETATDYQNNLKLLQELEDVPFENRQAQFRCVLILARSGIRIAQFEGLLKGYIHDCIDGEGGFGYDPLFYLPQYHRTLARLSFDEKNRISHRAKAFVQLKNFLANLDKNK